MILKKGLTIALACFALLLAENKVGHAKEKASATVSNSNPFYKKLGIGINTDGVFSRDNAGKLKVNYQKSDFEKIYKAGFKHVRLVIRVPLLVDARADSLMLDDIAVIKSVVDQILNSGLKVVFNPVHSSKEYKPKLENDLLLQDSFVKFWGFLSHSFRSYNPAKFIVEPFNEPHFMSAEKWYTLQERVVAEIRKSMPRHTIMVTPVTETITAVTSMKPLNDKRLLYSFHFYLPFELTHQGAPWTWKPFPAGYNYPNDNWDKEKLRKEFFYPLAQWANKNNINLYGGEFGVIKRADNSSRLKWIQDVGEIMYENKYPGAFWEYKKGEFSILKTDNPAEFDQTLLDALKLKD